MGCVSQLSCFSFERPIHQVRVAEFAISTHEVTFREYDRFAAATRVEMPLDEGWGRGDQPAIWVSWDDAKSYTRWLSVETGRTYRLPTEAEWEYVARAGSVTAYSWGNDVGTGRANCRGCGLEQGRATPVGSFTRPTHGACLTCMAMSGSGSRTVGIRGTAGLRRTDPRGLPRAAHAGFCVAVLGTTIQSVSGRPGARDSMQRSSYWSTAKTRLSANVPTSAWQGLAEHEHGPSTHHRAASEVTRSYAAALHFVGRCVARPQIVEDLLVLGPVVDGSDAIERRCNQAVILPELVHRLHAEGAFRHRAH